MNTVIRPICYVLMEEKVVINIINSRRIGWPGHQGRTVMILMGRLRWFIDGT